MEEKVREVTDVEKCKELFEYEMTEVVLMLKGEFAAVSGKEMGYLPCAASEDSQTDFLEILSKMKLPPIQPQMVDLPEALRSKLAAPTPFIGSIGEVVKATKLPFTPSRINSQLPDIKSGSCGCMLPDLSAPHQCTIPVPEIPTAPTNNMVPASYLLPKVTLPTVSTAPGMTILSVSIDKVNTDVPAAQKFAVKPPKVEYQRVCAALPPVPIAPKAVVPSTSVNSINTTVVPTAKPVAAKLPDLKCQAVRISRPVLTTLPKIDMPAASVASISVEIPAAQEFAVPPISVAMQANKVDIPSVIKHTLPTTVNAVTVNSAVVNIPSIGQYQIARPAQQICLQQLSSIAVPEKPDFTKERQDILSAAHN